MTAAKRVAHAAMDDATLVAAVASGNLDALGDLFGRHEPEVRRYLRRLGIARSDADDLVQATFLEVVRAASRFDPAHSTRSWLLGIATVMVRRRRRSVSRTLARLALWAGLAREPEPPTPAEVAEADETTRRLQRAFEALSAKKREVFVLVTLEGLSGEEAAHALNVPINTVWTRLHHARRELRAALEEGEA